MEILKANRLGLDTKDLDKTFQDYLDTANLKPKQNNLDALSDAQTFGTLLAKWENERPLPEIDEELKDVDKLGLYIDVFFRGHLAKMMGLKNGLSNLYNKFIKKYTKKPKYYKEILTSYRLCLCFIQPGAKAIGCPACPIMMLKILTSNGTCPLFVKQ